MENQEQNIGSSPIINQNQIPTPTPRKSKKLAIVLMVVGLILIAVTSPFLYVKYFTPVTPIQNLNTNTQTTTVDQFADWKTYRNEEYGFEFKYPEDWVVENKDEYSFQFISISKKTKTDEMGLILIITLFTNEQYSDMSNQCKNSGFEDSLDCYRLNNTFLGKNKDRYFVYDLSKQVTDFPQSFLGDGTFDIGLDVINTFKFISTSTASMSYENLVKNLPPDPGEAGKKTLEGIDSDGDGVRDDVQRWIVLNYPNSEALRRALFDMARKMQLDIISLSNTPYSIKPTECLLYIAKKIN